MADVRKGVKDSNAVPAGHADHDRVLVARYAADDAYGGEADQARQLVERCADCAQLAHDVRLLSAAVGEAPAPRRPRDFRITPEQAERLRGNAFERALRRFAAPGLAPLRPLAGVALSIGLAMAVVGTALPMPASVQPMNFDDRALAPAQEQDAKDRTAATADPVTAPFEEGPPAAATPGSQPHTAAGGTDNGFSDRAEGQGVPGDVRSVPPLTRNATGEDTDPSSERLDASDAPDTRSVLIFGGLAIALLSLGALVLLIVARRRLHDPLLR